MDSEPAVAVAVPRYQVAAARARALQESGASLREVVNDRYQVDFPHEFFLLAEALWSAGAPPGIYTNEPWQLVRPTARGGPAEHANALEEDELAVHRLDADLIPLLFLSGIDIKHGGSLLCYRTSELAAGRSTILGLPQDLVPGCVARRYGDSLLSVLREHFADRLQRREAEFVSPYNRGAGSLDQYELDGARSALAKVERLITSVSADD
jgi:hypothetical protein